MKTTISMKTINSMKTISFIFVAMMTLLVSMSSKAEILVYEFNNPAFEMRFNQLSQELRCPKCQNNNIADSNAPLSVDLKNIIYEQLHAGASDEEIVNYLVERYGDFITYRPPVKPSTWFIWFGPFVVLFIGAVVILRFVMGRKKPAEIQQQVSNDNNASANSQALLNEWKNEFPKDSQ